MKHYNYNPNKKPMEHLASLPLYLKKSASYAIFNGVRYWELVQDTDSRILQTIILPIHMELLWALSEILLEAQRPGRQSDTGSTVPSKRPCFRRTSPPTSQEPARDL